MADKQLINAGRKLLINFCNEVDYQTAYNKLIDVPYTYKRSMDSLYWGLNNTKLFFDVCAYFCIKDKTVFKKVFNSSYFIDFFDYCINHNLHEAFKNKGVLIDNSLQYELFDFIEKLGYKEILQVTMNYRALIHAFNLIIKKPTISYRELIASIIKHQADKEIKEVQGYFSTRYIDKAFYYTQITSDLFLDNYDISDYKSNHKCLLLFLLKPKKFTDNQIDKIIECLNNTLLYNTTNINELPIDKLREDYKKRLNSSLMIKKLQEF